MIADALATNILIGRSKSESFRRGQTCILDFTQYVFRNPTFKDAVNTFDFNLGRHAYRKNQIICAQYNLK